MSSPQFSRFLWLIRQCPFTCAVIAVSVALQAGVWLYPVLRPDDGKEALRRLGAVTQLGIYRQAPGEKSSKPVPQLFGPFDLWDGELWRVPVSGFHHVTAGHPANVLHLLMNCLVIAYLGSILEPRMGRWNYAFFFLTATTISMVPEFLLQNYALGLSGGGCALFGCLIVLRQREPAIADRIPDSLVQFMLISLVMCMVLTYFDVLAVANAAHMTGLVYGAAVGQLFFAQRRWKLPCQLAFFAGHLLLIPAAWFLVHPFWSGTYHWYRANEVSNKLANEDASARRKLYLYHMEQAVKREPSLQQPWRELTEYHIRQNDLQLAWKTILRGVDYNRTDDLAIKLGQKIWRAFRTPDERWHALEEMEAVFGDNSRAWQPRFGILPDRPLPGLLPLAMEFGVPNPKLQFQSDAERDFARLLQAGPVQTHELNAPPIKPERDDSALEGETL